MPLPPQTRIGRFEILALLGQGGMGEVYRARDTRLARDVAIKVLSPSLHADPDAVARFGQEARAASALNHAAIVTVFDAGIEQGQPYLVTELLEGQTLRQRLETGRVSLREALDIAIQVAGGLGVAHAAGIVHRDVKPENVFVTRGGVVKILDFGVARLAGDAAALSSAATTAGTTPGSIVGTVGYMAPEQARGQAVDSRADVFAFGCVLYEMLSGQRAFARATPVDSLAAVVQQELPDLPASHGVPAAVQRILTRCLKKDPADRFQSAVDLAFALGAARDDLSLTAPAPAARGADRLLRWAAIAAILSSAALASWTWLRPAAESTASSIDAISLVPPSAKPIAPALSPDGKWVAYISVADAQPHVWVQFLNGGVPINLTKDTDIPVSNRTIVGGLDIAPDGSAVGLAGRPRATGLWTIPGAWVIPAPLGGPPRRVTDRFASLRWSPDGRQFAAVIANPLVGDALAVSGLDGQDERTVVPAGSGLHLHQVAWSPDGRFLYYAQTLETNHAVGEIYRAPVSGGTPERVVATRGVAMFPAPTPDGRGVIYAGNHSGEGLNIWYHPLDGGPDRRLTAGAGEYTEPSISRDGTMLVCLARRRKGELVRLDVTGTGAVSPVTVGIEGSGDGEPSTSAAAGGRLFITSARTGRRKVWSVDYSGGQAKPLTTGDAIDHRPVISPDGSQLAYVSNREGRRELWVMPAAGGTPRLLQAGAVLDNASWAPDSRRLVYAMAGEGATTLWTLEAGGGAPVRIPGVSGRTPAWSPTGDLIAISKSDNDQPAVHFITSTGAKAREPLSIGPIGLPTALAFSPDGRHIAMINLPGRAAAEVWVLNVTTGAFRLLTQFPAPAELDGITWTPDGRSVIVGRTDYETEVLLLRGLK